MAELVVLLSAELAELLSAELLSAEMVTAEMAVQQSAVQLLVPAKVPTRYPQEKLKS
jgi:hypothetical protein